MSLILASGSAARRQMLEAAGLTIGVQAPRVDEDAAKASLRAQGLKPRDQADALAELKALSVSRGAPDFVIGADQMLAVENEVLDKPKDIAEARTHLLKLRGRTHELITAAVVAREGAIIWRHIDTPKLKMRAFSDVFLDDYMERVGEGALRSVGAYQL
ncbi:MAG: Maf family protein, partial [Hyphomonadaceae bacterium]|nr:Maf family protein [Hyphomonadaceae bacterium]